MLLFCNSFLETPISNIDEMKMMSATVYSTVELMNYGNNMWNFRDRSISETFALRPLGG
jgi:hypothetical protein